MGESLVGIIGWPVSHSQSPKMHSYAFSKLGLFDWRYLFLPVDIAPKHRLQEAVFGLRALNFVGANITVPHKEAVLPLMDSLSDEALCIGAVNTIHIKDGQLLGHNTDAPGFVNDLLEQGIDISAMKVLLLGAGGSARAITYGLLAHGCKSITILNRTEEKALVIAKAMSQRFSESLVKTAALDFSNIKNNAHADLIINTTSIGLTDLSAMPWDPQIHFSSSQVVYDIIYGKKTKFLQHASLSQARAIDGLGMLIHQGALAFSIWTGLKAPVQIMKDCFKV